MHKEPIFRMRLIGTILMLGLIAGSVFSSSFMKHFWSLSASSQPKTVTNSSSTLKPTKAEMVRVSGLTIESSVKTDQLSYSIIPESSSAPSNAASSLATLPSGWFLPTGSNNFCGYFGWLGYSSSFGGYHLAQDMCNPQGAPVYSIGDGDVIYSRTDVGSYGPGDSRGGALVARYRAADGTWFTALYGHLNNPHGTGHVSAGEVIGFSNAYSPPHVHFAVHPGFDPEPDNPWRGYTSNRSVTYGFTDPISFLNAHPRGQAGGNCTFTVGQGRSGAELTAFQNVFNNAGGRTIFGCPDSPVRTDGFTSFLGTTSHYQTFTNGGKKSDIEFLASGNRANQAYAVLSPLYEKWASFSFVTSNRLGYPIENLSSESTTCYGTRMRYQSFESGSLQYLLSGSRSGSVFEVHGAIHSKWRIKGYAGCPLGAPLSDESDARPSGKSGRTGKLNAFEGGHIYFLNGSNQAYEVHGAIYQTYVGMGGSGSWLGFPITDEYVASGYARNDFEGGYITTTDGVHYRAFGNTVTQCGDANNIRESIQRLNHFLANNSLPDYLPAGSAVEVIHSFRLQAYDELYYSALDLRGLAGNSLIYARRFLNQGDADSACKYLQQGSRYIRLMTDTESTAVLVWQTRVNNVSDIIRSVYDGSKAGVIFGVDYLGEKAGLGAKAGLAAELLYLPLDYALDKSMYGEEEAVKRLKDRIFKEVLVKVVIGTVRLPQLGNKTIREYIEKGVNHTVGRSELYNLLEAASKNPEFHRELVRALAFVMSEASTAAVERVATELEQNFLDALQSGSGSFVPSNSENSLAQAAAANSPLVLNTFPAKDAAYVDVNLSSLSITFSENILPNTRAVNVTDSKGRAVSVIGSSTNGSIFSVSLGASLSRGSAYKVTVQAGAVINSAGVGNDQLVWSFSTSPSPLSIGANVTVANTGGVGLNLRSSPAFLNDGSNVIMVLPEGSAMSIIGGPTQSDGYTWWNIRGGGQTGWGAIGDWLTATDSNGLRIGAEVKVANTSGVGLRLRSEPSINGERITTLVEGTRLTLISGPYYVDGYLWWNVKGSAGTGYCAVAYWLFPQAQPEMGTLTISALEPSALQIRDWNQSVVYSAKVTDANGNLIDGAKVTGDDNLQGTLVITTFPTTDRGFVSYGTHVPNEKANGTYDITFRASKEGYAPSATITRQVQVNHLPGPAPTPTPTYSIRGRITDAYGNGIPNVDVVYGGARLRPDDAYTDNQGYYLIGNAFQGITYNVTPLKTGYTFNPPSQRFDTISSNQTADFIGSSTAPSAPVLLTEEGTDKAVAVESVMRTRDPFPQNATSSFSPDGRPRLMLFATNLTLAPGEGFADLSIQAEDAAHRMYPLTIEYAGKVPDVDALTSIIVRPNDQMIDDGDVWVSIAFRGVESNKARVTFSSGAQPQFLSFLEGNPGRPGDGVTVNATGGQLGGFELFPYIPLSGNTNGLTFTVFLPPGTPNLKSLSFNIISLKPPGPCQASFGGGGGFITGRVAFNGVQGSFVNMTQAELEGLVRGANSFYPGCNFTLNDLYIGKVYLSPDNAAGPPINITTLDAAAFGHGQYNYPGTQGP